MLGFFKILVVDELLYYIMKMEFRLCNGKCWFLFRVKFIFKCWFVVDILRYA